MILKKDAKFLENIINKFNKNNLRIRIAIHFWKKVLAMKILCGIEVLLSGKITMSEVTKNLRIILQNL